MAEVAVARVAKGFKLLAVVSTWMALLATMTSGVQAVDIQGFSSDTECSGAGFTFSGIDELVCTAMSVGSIQIRDLSSCQTGRVYNGGGCSNVAGNGNGPTVWCFVGGGFTGADWFNGCRRRKLQGTDHDTHDSSPKCTHKSFPNGVHYTENPSLGSWILKTRNATAIMDQLLRVVDAEKASWLQALGAYYVAGAESSEVVN